MAYKDITIEELKQSLDIVQVAQMYGELVKSGSNYVYKDDRSISISPSKQIFSNFNGEITGGSVLDLVCYMENLSIADGIKRLKELAGKQEYKLDLAKMIKRKEKEEKKKSINFQKLGYIGVQELRASKSLYADVVDEKENLLGVSLIGDGIRKLFQADFFEPSFKPKLDYIFNRFIGYNSFFKCPSIILRDDTDRIVDVIAYRPQKPANYKEWSSPKYIYKNPTNRGEKFLYPFRKEAEYIAKKEGFFIVGEGIKNALNALVYSVPFITIESSSTKMSDALVSYIRAWYEKGYSIITMFDGDKAGAKAYENFKERTGLEVKNFFAFDSGLDFVDYLQSGESV